MPSSRQDNQTLSTDLFCMRGIGILFVVVVHVLGVDAVHGVRKLFAADRMDLRVVNDIIHSFNMAVMLMGSGVAVAAFGRADTSLGLFLRKKLNKLLVPMLVWAPILFVTQELLRAKPQGLQGWLGLLSQVPGTWFPPYSIFWFVHALIGCTLISWLFRKYAEPQLGRWSGAVYVGASIVLYELATLWVETTHGAVAEYVDLILYWNRFFGLGLCVYPWLAPTSRWLSRQSVSLQALVPAGFFALLSLVYVVLPLEQYEWTRTINGPLGFCMLFSLVVFLRQRGAARGGLWKESWSRLLGVGSLSMVIYLFHLYFVVGARVALDRWHAQPIVALHVGVGILAGYVGPWVIGQLLKGVPLFHWSIGSTPPAQRSREVEEPPREGLAPIR
ncbi:acyltransferase family protein [Hyalangium minutum]|uniref:Acyltransferase n=1 Tax=Hyalangium minutum TaxID=394096 RepID=A0A085VZY6_9BACT|nr:acyltransferase [Hyalangium minutum]KFE60999.1 acyltransferase [Hyalangium minutum]